MAITENGRSAVFIDYERVVAYHGHRQDNPWENGGALIIEVPRDLVRDEERRLIAQMGQADNHHGWTVEVRDGRSGTTHSYPVTLRFSDLTMTVWAMPPGWQGVGTVVTKRRYGAEELCSMFHGGSPRAWYDERNKEQWVQLAEQLSR